MPKRIRLEDRYLLAPGAWLEGKERIQIQGFLARGAFAAAYRAVNERGEVCFVKEYFPASRPSEAAELDRVYATERDVVRRIGNYELIPRFWDAFSYEGFNYLITDFIPGPDLETVIKSGQRPRIDRVIQWCVCLCQELAFLHSRGVVHHDLKPENIRLNADGDPVLVDFSAAYWYRTTGEVNDQIYGSDSFLAPEYAGRGSEDLPAGQKMDVFALGRILVELITGLRLSQDEINQRQDQLYGQILHSNRIDPSFVRAVFRAVAYEPEKRFASGVQMAEDITPAAPPVGRARPGSVDFGRVTDSAPKELAVQAYNVGGGTLRAEIAVEGDWIEVGVSGAVTGKSAMFERNRQSIRVVGFPERLPAGATGAGRVVLTMGDHVVEIPVRMERSVEVSEIQVTPSPLNLFAPPGGVGQARLTFSNNGSAPARVQLRRPQDLLITLEREEFTVPAKGRQEVTVKIESTVLGDREMDSQLEWLVEGNPRPSVPIHAGIRRGAGILTSLSGVFGKKK